jgi:hypothetical protein
VGFPGAKADSTGVIGTGTLVGDVSCTGTEVAVGAGEVQALKTSTKDKTKQEAKRSVFI